MPEEPTVEVERLVAGGSGLARQSSGRVVFVDGGLPGERVRVHVIEERADFARAPATEVLRPAPGRVAPWCPQVAAGCGGCDLQHLRPEAQAPAKSAIVTDALRRLGRLPAPSVRPGPGVAPTGYRTTVRALVVGDRAGLRKRASHDGLVVEHCLIAHPRIDDLLRLGRFPGAHEVTLRAGARTGDRLVLGDPGAAGFELPDDVIVVGRDELRAGRVAYLHELAAGRRWRISADSFFQSGPEAADALAATVADMVEAAGGARIADLYGGVGLFAGCLADRAAARDRDVEILLVEGGASAASDARHNLADVPVTVVEEPVERWRPEARDVVVADPPRSGLRKAGVARATATGARRIVLVSCDAAALGRDTRLLAEAGYRHRRSVLVDVFPMTSHVEVVTAFDRADGPDLVATAAGAPGVA